ARAPRLSSTLHLHHPPTPDIHTLSLHDALPISAGFGRAYSICYHLRPPTRVRKIEPAGTVALETIPEPTLRHHHLKSGALPAARSEEHTSELQSLTNLVCRLLLEKKKIATRLSS